MHDFVTHLTEISEQVVQKYRIYYPSGWLKHKYPCRWELSQTITGCIKCL
jgi:hypothetical protein